MKHINKKLIKFFAAAIFLAVFVLNVSFVHIVCAAYEADAECGVLNVGDESLPVYTLQKARNDNESYVILFLGDGYKKSEQDKFIGDIKARVNSLLATEPFCSMSDRLNMYAVPTVSNESGVSTPSYTMDTYFGIEHSGITTYFNRYANGDSKARAIKAAAEGGFLDKGGSVGAVHILSNSKEYFGSASGGNRLMSFSSLTEKYSGGQALIHELAHSIGKLKDEYGFGKEGPNTWVTADEDSIPWKGLLGFRGVGITDNGNVINEEDGFCYIPTMSCIMREPDLGEFCQVCKLELVRRMSMTMYNQNPKEYYILDPDITIEHSRTGAIGKAYDDCCINEANIDKANGEKLEFRTVIQNLTNRERNFSLTFEITDKDGNKKYSKTENYVVPPLDNEYNPDAAIVSATVTFDSVSGLKKGDKISGIVKDNDKGVVAATDKTESDGMCKVTLRHKLKDLKGSISDMQNVSETTVYVPKYSEYRVNPIKQLNGFTYIGNSLNSVGKIVTDESLVVDLYYRQGEAPSVQVAVSDGGRSFAVDTSRVEDGSLGILALYDGNELKEVKTFKVSGDEFKCTAAEKYSRGKVMVWNETSLCPACPAPEFDI